MNAKKVKDLINKELWSNPNASLIKVSDFEEVESIVEKLKKPEERADFKALCLEDIEDVTKKPIIPMYLISIVGKHPVDDSYALDVFDEFYHASRWNEVVHIGSKIIQFNESSYVIKVLAETYGILKDEDKKIEFWEHLIKVDHNETDVFYFLAEYYEAKGDSEKALNFYKRVIQRHIKQNDLISINKAWQKITSICNDDANYLILLATRIARNMGNDKGVFFLRAGLDNGNFDINSKIRILKQILTLSPSNKESVDAIVTLFREKYSQNPRLEYCLANTGLLGNYMQADLAVQKFEKEIEFNEGAFVYHNTWKLGRIKTVEQDEVIIQFLTQKELHKMSSNMAFSSLKILPKQHIMVLKAGAPAQKVKERLMSDIEWGLRMLLTSFNGQASLKQIKAELVPSILSDSDWSAWQSMAKKQLSSNPYFSTSDESNDIYVLRDTPITFEEKTLQLFSREKGFYKKYDILKDFLKNNGNTDCEEFSKMISYFESEVKTVSNSSIPALLILNTLKEKEGISFVLTDTFEDKYASLDSNKICEIYKDISDNDLKHIFVDYIQRFDENYQKTLVCLLHVQPSSYIVAAISEGPKKRLIKDIIIECATDVSSDVDLLLYFFKNLSEEEWEEAGYNKEELLIAKLNTIIYINNKLSLNDEAKTAFKPRQNALYEDLFSKGEIVKYLEKCDTTDARRVYSFVSNIPAIEEDKLISIKHYILSNRKDAEEIVGSQEEKQDLGRMIPKGFLCTKAMFDAKTAELEHIMNVEIPENSKEIGTARDLGDLRENAEYQYAKDKQKNLNFMMNKLTDEIDIAKIIEPTKVDTNYVEFGTKVVFNDNLTGKEVSYTVLGPWESNPEKNILNFQAPLGQKIYNMKKGDNKKFKINGVKFDYTVVSIELANFKL